MSRPSSVNQEVAGSSPARGANNCKQLATLLPRNSVPAANHGATGLPPITRVANRTGKSSSPRRPLELWTSERRVRRFATTNGHATGPQQDVKAELSCPENTEVRCPLFTDTRVR